MGFFDDDVVLTEKQNEMRDRLIGKSRYLNNTVIVEADKMLDPELDSGKIALKCEYCVLCIRDHCGYANYRISDRSDCPSTCALNISK